MKKLLIPFIVLFGLSMNAIALDKSHKELRGDKYYFVYSFQKAIDSYTDAKHLSVEGERRLAKSYHNLNQNTLSESAYLKLTSETEGSIPEDLYEYAMILKNNGKTEEAGRIMDRFIALKPQDLRAKDYVANHNNLSKLSGDDGTFKINGLSMNTDAQDFGATYYKDKIVFTSTGAKPDLMKRTYNWNGKPFLNIYVSEVENGQLKKPVIFDKSLDGKMHDGPACFSNDGNFMAFTRNNYDLKRKDRVVNLQICFSSFKEGKWSKPEPFILNSNEYSVGHPSLSSDGNTMYFASDMPGGYGGTDLYRIKKDGKGVWGKAENLGYTINTEGDELFPFYEDNNQVLFFSSNGRFGLGGQDIFMCALNGDKFGKVSNAGSPLNTSSDDFAIIADKNLNKGYVSSNRVGGAGDDDIYSVDIQKSLNIGKKIQGIAKDKNGIAIPETFIALKDDQENTIDTVTTGDDGAYTFLVEANKNFKLTGNKITYLEGTNVANTFGKEFNVKADVVLLQKEAVVAQKVEIVPEVAKVIILKSIYFDLDKYDIRPDAVIVLNNIIRVMNENPEMIVKLSSYTDCRASNAYNQILSDNRAFASAEFIKKGITSPERISGKGYGETHLVNNCACEGTVVSSCSDYEFQQDRRTEFIIVKKEGNLTLE